MFLFPLKFLKQSLPAEGRFRRFRHGCVAFEAFSLVELLVVMAIIGLIFALGIPALSSLGSSRGVTQAAYEISALLELARAEAVARQTYVWVGIKPEKSGPSTVLRLGAVYSKDGSAQIANNSQPLTRAFVVSGVTLTDFAVLNPGTKAELTNRGLTVSAEAANSHNASFRIGNVDFNTGGSATITFTPRGEALLKGSPAESDGFDPLIGIGLQPTRGSATLSNADDAGVVLDGSVGIPLIVRRNSSP